MKASISCLTGADLTCWVSQGCITSGAGKCILEHGCAPQAVSWFQAGVKLVFVLSASPVFLLNNRRTRTVARTMEATFRKILPGRTPYANEIPPCILSDSSHWMVYSWLQSQLENERPLHFRCLLLNELFSFMWLMEKESTFGYLKCKKLSPVKCISNLHCSNRVVVTMVVWGRTGDTAMRTS